MARYFGGNSLAAFFRNSTAVVEVTTGGRFDSAYVANAIVVTPTQGISIRPPFLDGSTSLTGTVWFRFDLYNSLSNNNLPFLLMTNGGANAYRIAGTASTSVFQMQYWNSGTLAWVNWGGTFTATAATLNTIVLKLEINVGYEVWVAGSSLASSAVVPTNGASAVDMIECYASNSGTNQAFFSQFMIADYDLRDSHLMSAALNGNSATNTSGTGAYTDVNETVLDEGTAIILAAAGKKGQTKASITLPSGLGISGLLVNARARVSGGTVTSGKLGVRSNSANYSSTSRGWNGGYEPRGAIWEGDPGAGGAAWSETTFNNAEIYEEAV